MLKKKIFWIIILGLILRLIVIDQSLWLDESIGAWAVKNFSYNGIVNDFLLSDNHPPLYYLILKLWTSIFGYSEISLRMPSILFGLGAIGFTYKIAEQVFKRYPHLSGKTPDSVDMASDKNKPPTVRYPFIAALLLATSPLHIYYSQEARMYSVAAFFASTSIYFFLNTFDTNGKKDWLLYSLSIVALVFTDYMPVFLLPVFWLFVLLRRKHREWIKYFALAHLPLLIAGFIWMPTFLEQSAKGRWLLQTLPAWKDIAGGASFKQAVLVWMKFVFGRISFEPKWIYYSLVGIGSVPFIISFKSLIGIYKKLNKKKITIVFWLSIPLILGYLASFIFPAFIYFRYIYVLPAFYLTTILGISYLNNYKFKVVLIAWILLTNMTGLLIYYLDSDQHREDWRSAAAFIDETAVKNDVVLFEYPQPFTPYRWYSKSNNISYGATNSISADPEMTQENTRQLIKGKNRIFHFDYLKDLTDPQDVIESTIKESGYSESKVYEFRGIGQVEIWQK